MATLSVQDPTRSGIALTFNAAAGGGDAFANDGQTYVIIRNDSVAPITVTFTIVQTVEGSTPAGRAYVVAAGATFIIPPFPAAQYTNPATGLVNITYSGVTTLFVALFKARL